MRRYLFTFLILSLLINNRVLAEDVEDVSLEVSEIKQNLNVSINSQIEEQKKQPVIPQPTLPRLELNDRVLNYSLTSSFTTKSFFSKAFLCIIS